MNQPLSKSQLQQWNWMLGQEIWLNQPDYLTVQKDDQANLEKASKTIHVSQQADQKTKEASQKKPQAPSRPVVQPSANIPSSNNTKKQQPAAIIHAEHVGQTKKREFALSRIYTQDLLIISQMDRQANIKTKLLLQSIALSTSSFRPIKFRESVLQLPPSSQPAKQGENWNIDDADWKQLAELCLIGVQRILEPSFNGSLKILLLNPQLHPMQANISLKQLPSNRVHIFTGLDPALYAEKKYRNDWKTLREWLNEKR